MVYKEHKQYRLPGYKYDATGIYFVTICVKDRLPVLSTVGTCRGTFLPSRGMFSHDRTLLPENNIALSTCKTLLPDNYQDQNAIELILSPIGEVAQHFWQEIPNRFPAASLDEWVIMPDHVHGLIQLGDGLETGKKENAENVPQGEHAPRRVPTEKGLQPLKRGSLSSIVNHFKGNVKRWCNQNGYEEFAWQPRFYDHIVRNDQDLIRIREYIRQNPERWLIKDNP
ncbi:transposase [Adhaeribacter pallidiroseus]|uniref:Transposase IS200-like domain-containing protein n=1 Tax=Adhaeribacter pallidiroseus TaxID=2072847 RepID=A0A369QR91_9BACT|nr:transposase [Adhaeribacter pallidiroseus]RDC65349.1 uncharacterized protein AHMF7616_03979 [Adhaeribacter pallidiroseus]